MTRSDAPDEVVAAARARADARKRRDWAQADRLKAVIEAAGWKVVDRGIDYRLAPAAPPDVIENGRTRYGSSASVPSRLDAAPVGLASVVVVARDRPDELERGLAALREHAPDGVQVVVVADGPNLEQAAALEALDALDPGGPGIGTEVVWTAGPLGRAGALNAGIRRAGAAIVLALDPARLLPAGDVVTPLADALADDTVGVVGAAGLRFEDPTAPDFRRLLPASGDVDAIDGSCLAFRRADYVARGPLDEHFRDAAWLDVWWSLVLREARPASPARRAVALANVPIVRTEARPAAPDSAEARMARRNYYRLLDRFRQPGGAGDGDSPAT